MRSGAFKNTLKSPGLLVFNSIALIFALLHSVTWFQAVPKALPLRRGENKVPPRLLIGAHYVADARAERGHPHHRAGLKGRSTVRRSNEPLFWSLFSAGGMLAALLAPALIIVTGFLVPANDVTFCAPPRDRHQPRRPGGAVCHRGADLFPLGAPVQARPDRRRPQAVQSGPRRGLLPGGAWPGRSGPE